MAINIKNREAERLLNSLVQKTHLGKSRLVLDLLRRESQRQSRMGDQAARKKRIGVLSRKSARRIGKHAPSPEEIIGYGDEGVPE